MLPHVWLPYPSPPWLGGSRPSSAQPALEQPVPPSVPGPQALEQALRLRVDKDVERPPLSLVAEQTAHSALSMPLADWQRHRRMIIDKWRRHGKMPHCRADEPFHSALIAQMDLELDIFDRGDAWLREPLIVFEPLVVFQVVGQSAELTGVIAYDQAVPRRREQFVCSAASSPARPPDQVGRTKRWYQGMGLQRWHSLRGQFRLADAEPGRLQHPFC